MAKRKPNPIPFMFDKDRWRFFKKVQVTESCHIWTGAKSNGYGAFGLEGKTYPAARVAYFIATGQDPDDARVSHTCGNTACVNPEHLLLGMNKSNPVGTATQAHVGHRRPTGEPIPPKQLSRYTPAMQLVLDYAKAKHANNL